MKHLLPLLALLPAACGLPDIHDLRVDRVLPPEAVAFPIPELLVNTIPGIHRHWPRGRPIGVVAEISTSADLYRYERHYLGTFGQLLPYIVPCGEARRGQPAPEARQLGVEYLLGPDGEEWPPDYGRPAPPPGPDGRFTYTLPIRLTPAIVKASESSRPWNERRIELYDLRRERDDLCITILGTSFIYRDWTTNLAVIPRRAIDIALGQAPP